MYKPTFCLFLAVILFACDMTNPADLAVISTVQADMQIDLANSPEAPTQFAFRLSTLEEKCANARILADGAIQGQSVHIAVSGLLVEPDCTGEYDVVQKDLKMDLLPGDYDFSLAIGEDLFNTGILSFDGIAYTLEMNSFLGIQVGHSKMYRIPEGVIWGSISGNMNISEIKEEFISALRSVTSEVQLPEGYFGHFTIRESDVLNLNSTDGVTYNFNHLFVYQLVGSPDGLQFIIDNFRAQYGDVVNISCTAWTGDSF